MLYTALLIAIAVLLLLVKLPARYLKRINGYPFATDLGFTIAGIVIFAGTFAGTVVGLYVGLFIGVAVLFAKWFLPAEHFNVRQRQWEPVDKHLPHVPRLKLNRPVKRPRVRMATRLAATQEAVAKAQPDDRALWDKLNDPTWHPDETDLLYLNRGLVRPDWM